jgi:flagellin
MRIQHNILAMNSYRNYSNNVSSLSSNLEKLSSGYKINRAGDDAAGLAISEKMRAQIKGLDAAEKNVADGISLVKTGEGAMQEIQDMLSRMKYLATQSANGTYDNDVDRANLQKEVDALKTEINRIADSSNFNGINLLDGSLSGASQVDNIAMDMTTAYKGKYVSGAATVTGTLVDTGATKLGVNDIGKTINYTVNWTDGVGGEEKTTTVSLTFQGDGTGVVDTSANGIANGANYFTDVNGTHYSLTAGTLSATKVQSAIVATLKADEEFASKFNVSKTTGATTITFEAKEAGSDGGVITGMAVSEDTSLTLSDVFGTTVTITNKPTVSQEAYDSQQRFNVSNIKVAKASDTLTKMEAKIFTVDGHKFLAYNGAANQVSDTQIKALGDDVTLIKLSADTTAAADAKEIAAQIQRVTGYETKGYTAAVTNSDYAAGDVVFTKDVLSLSGNELTLQIGDTADDYNQMGVKIDDMHTSALGLDDVDISTIEGAQSAIETIKNAINSVSMTRGTLGAVQNRLEHTANNLSVMNENISDAESTIRDTDIAEEMTAYTKNNILVQSAQAMLAQANSVPQGVLQLLQ